MYFSLDTLYYNKSLPLTIPIPDGFKDDLILVIDGVFLQSSPTQVLEIAIVDAENKSLSNFSLNAIDELWAGNQDVSYISLLL